MEQVSRTKTKVSKKQKEETMKTKTATRIMLMLMIMALAVMVPQFADASTAPCTTITNTANVDYTVGGVGQDDIDSAPVTFDVGVKVIVTVVSNDGDNISVVPGTTKAALKFTVTNSGNAVHDYDLTAIAFASGTNRHGDTDTFDGTDIKIYDDGGGTAGSFDATDVDITATGLNNVAIDGTDPRIVYIVYNPTDLSEDDLEIAAYHLLAVSKWADDSAITYPTDSPTLLEAGGTCDGLTSIDIVRGDPAGTASGDTAGDGDDSDNSGFIVSSATIGIVKSQDVIWDPVNFATGSKYIPGAIVEYTVVVSNTGGADAVLTDIVDVVQSELTLISTFFDADLGTDTPSSTHDAFLVDCTADCGARACIAGTDEYTSGTVDGIIDAAGTWTATMGTVLDNTGTCGLGELDGPNGTVTIRFQAYVD